MHASRHAECRVPRVEEWMVRSVCHCGYIASVVVVVVVAASILVVFVAVHV